MKARRSKDMDVARQGEKDQDEEKPRRRRTSFDMMSPRKRSAEEQTEDNQGFALPSQFSGKLVSAMRDISTRLQSLEHEQSVFLRRLDQERSSTPSAASDEPLMAAVQDIGERLRKLEDAVLKGTP
jgi:hypothetical protein